METKIQSKTKIIYELAADVMLVFSNGDPIRISKAVAALHGDFFIDVFFGPNATTEFHVQNFDSETFKTFLDCLFGLKEYSVLDCLLIFPIAHEYQVKESLEKCVEVLSPKVMDKNVPIILNLALFYKNDEILNNVIKFIKNKNGIVDFIENMDYRGSLEPGSICRLIEEVDLNSFVWKILHDWGKSYLDVRGKTIDVRSFFKNNGILSKLQADHLESDQVALDLHGMDLLSSDQIVMYFKNKVLNPEMKLPDKSDWVKLTDETFTETVVFAQSFGCLSDEHANGAYLEVSTNKVFFENFELNNNPQLKIKSQYFFRTLSCRTDSEFVSMRHENLNCPIPTAGIEMAHHRCNYDNISKCICFIPLRMSKLDPSSEIKQNLEVSSDGLVFQIDLELEPKKFHEIKSIEITYSFKNIHKFRILKTSLNGNFEKSDKLYFTKNVVLCAK